jgi:hypothetical protein
MELNSYFKDFLSKIRPTDNQKNDYQSGHKTLRKRLMSYDLLEDIIVSTFIQGSYRRATAVRPNGDKRPDVDVVVVTRLSRKEYPEPQKAMDLFIPFLDEYYKSKYTTNARSFGIELSYVDLDLVITSAPSESQIGILGSEAVTSDLTPEDSAELIPEKLSLFETKSLERTVRFWEAAAAKPGWKTEHLYIPDREVKIWEPTHPLAQIEWTWGKNKDTNSHYVNVVKALKWWRRVMHPDIKYPKGYPLEHMIGACCPDNIQSIAEGVTKALETITTRYQYEGENSCMPWLSDHGVPEHNVFARVSGDDFAVFYSQVKEAATIAHRAYDLKGVDESAAEWQKLFGNKFPGPVNNENENGKSSKGAVIGGFSERKEKTEIQGGRFA